MKSHASSIRRASAEDRETNVSDESDKGALFCSAYFPVANPAQKIPPTTSAATRPQKRKRHVRFFSKSLICLGSIIKIIVYYIIPSPLRAIYRQELFGKSFAIHQSCRTW